MNQQVFQSREFSQESYDKNDSTAKTIFSEYCKRNNLTILKDEEDFDHDMIIGDAKGNVVHIELEMDNGSEYNIGESYPYPRVRFYGRKIRLHKKHPFLYVKICAKTHVAVFVRSERIFQEKHRRDVMTWRGWDEVYELPVKDCSFIDLKK